MSIWSSKHDSLS